MGGILGIRRRLMHSREKKRGDILKNSQKWWRDRKIRLPLSKQTEVMSKSKLRKRTIIDRWKGRANLMKRSKRRRRRKIHLPLPKEERQRRKLKIKPSHRRKRSRHSFLQLWYRATILLKSSRSKRWTALQF